jgi:hypothetical protein
MPSAPPRRPIGPARDRCRFADQLGTVSGSDGPRRSLSKHVHTGCNARGHAASQPSGRASAMTTETPARRRTTSRDGA